jgi:membrane protein involved in colicin uptake
LHHHHHHRSSSRTVTAAAAAPDNAAKAADEPAAAASAKAAPPKAAATAGKGFGTPKPASSGSSSSGSGSSGKRGGDKPRAAVRDDPLVSPRAEARLSAAQYREIYDRLIAIFQQRPRDDWVRGGVCVWGCRGVV